MIVLIGCNGTLGSSLTEKLSQSKQSIFCLSRKKPKKIYPDMQFNVSDVSTPFKLTYQFENILSKNKVNAVIYNAATSFSSPDLKSLSDKQLLEMINVNILATTKLLQTLENKRYRNGELIRFIYISTNSIKTLNASNPFYIATKAASENLVLNFAKRMGQHCSANIVRPGLMRSNLTKDRFDVTKQKVIELTPSKRLASPTETAKVIINLIFDMPPTFTGQILAVDGGRSI